MNEDEYKLWQDLMKEVLVLSGLQTELEKKIAALYEKVDNQLDKENQND
jgi:hypothetical protein